MVQAEAEKRIAAIREHQVWDDESMVELLIRFIKHHDDAGNTEALADWLERQAEEENRAYMESKEA